jgi:hypothetical protein
MKTLTDCYKILGLDPDEARELVQGVLRKLAKSRADRTLLTVYVALMLVAMVFGLGVAGFFVVRLQPC